MFLFDSPLFWYRLVFLAELIVSEGLFTFKLKKRSFFALRVAASVLGCYVVTFLFPLCFFDESFFNAFYVSFMFVFMFCLTVAALYLCYDVPLLSVIFCAVAAYAVQHIAYELYTLFVTALDVDVGDLPYGESGSMSFSVWSMAIYIEGYAAVYGLMYLLFGSRIRTEADLHIGNVSLLVISGVIVLVAVLLNAVLTYRITEETDVVIVCMMHGCIMISCILAVFVQFSLLDRKDMQSEIDTLQRLHKQERQHYMLFKENVDYINIKCHDLKHQIRRIARAGKVEDSVISEIENAVMIYDSDVKTGNETLDIILTEKRLVCVKNQIVFSCIADGEKLGFMSDADICALFGNALDNAIEAVCRIENAEKRSISLTVKTVRDFLSVCVRNSCLGDIVFEDGLPRSTKGDAVNHGYGMKSIKSIVGRYGGEFSVAAHDEIFELNMLFPGR